MPALVARESLSSVSEQPSRLKSMVAGRVSVTSKTGLPTGFAFKAPFDRDEGSRCRGFLHLRGSLYFPGRVVPKATELSPVSSSRALRSAAPNGATGGMLDLAGASGPPQARLAGTPFDLLQLFLRETRSQPLGFSVWTRRAWRDRAKSAHLGLMRSFRRRYRKCPPLGGSR